MEILSLGMKNVCTCSQCGSKLGYNADDIKVEKPNNKKCLGSYEEMEYEDFYDAYIVCPVCLDKKIYVSTTRSVKAALIDAKRQAEQSCLYTPE
jgi:Zn finger protein HypA/HybF involved in hydrogenase expression